VPLSEHEQRLLDQIERALYAEDPKFATTVRSTDLRTHARRRVRRAGVLFGIGFVLLLAGVTNPVVGIAGFVVMLVALVIGLTAWKRLGGGGSTTLRAVDGGAQRPTRRKARAHGSPKERLEERWRKRWEERGGPE
jgi:predicted tellurium resistance membrane protein TerC